MFFIIIFFLSWLSMIVQGNIVLNRTVVDSNCSPGWSCPTCLWNDAWVQSFHKKYYSVFKSPATMIETLTCFLKNFDSIEFKSFMISAYLFMPGLGDVYSEVNAVFFPFSDAWPFLFLWRIFSWPSGKFMPCNNTNREFNCQGSVSTVRAVSLFLQI